MLTLHTHCYELSTADAAQRQKIGDLMCISASALIAVNIMWAGRARKVLRLFTYTFATNAVVTINLMILTFLINQTPIDFSQHGMFGWLGDTDMIWMISLFGFIVGMNGILGFNFAVKYVNPVIFSTVQLLDPGLTAYMSWICQLEKWPKFSTMLGVVIVTIGIMVVVVFEHRRRVDETSLHLKNRVSNGGAGGGPATNESNHHHLHETITLSSSSASLSSSSSSTHNNGLASIISSSSVHEYKPVYNKDIDNEHK